MAATDYSTIYVLFAGYVAFKIWSRAGGWPIAWYRIRGVNYLQAYIIGATTKVERPTIRFDRLEQHTPPSFKWQGGDYVLGDNDHKFANPYGAPAYLYNFDDSRPLPIMKTPIDDKNNPLPKMDPLLVRAGYHNGNLEKLHGLTEKGHVARDSVVVLLLVVGVMAAILSAWYSYNATCAVHSIACAGVAPR